MATRKLEENEDSPVTEITPKETNVICTTMIDEEVVKDGEPILTARSVFVLGITKEATLREVEVTTRGATTIETRGGVGRGTAGTPPAGTKSSMGATIWPNLDTGSGGSRKENQSTYH